MSFMNTKNILTENFFKDFVKVYKQIRTLQKVKKLSKKDPKVKQGLSDMEKSVNKINKLGQDFEKQFEKVFGKKPKQTKPVDLKDFF